MYLPPCFRRTPMHSGDEKCRSSICHVMRLHPYWCAVCRGIVHECSSLRAQITTNSVRCYSTRHTCAHKTVQTQPSVRTSHHLSGYNGGPGKDVLLMHVYGFRATRSLVSCFAGDNMVFGAGAPAFQCRNISLSLSLLLSLSPSVSPRTRRPRKKVVQ